MDLVSSEDVPDASVIDVRRFSFMSLLITTSHLVLHQNFFQPFEDLPASQFYCSVQFQIEEERKKLICKLSTFSVEIYVSMITKHTMGQWSKSKKAPLLSKVEMLQSTSTVMVRTVMIDSFIPSFRML